MQDNIIKKFKIIKIEAADLIIAQNHLNEEKHSISIRDSKGKISGAHFKGYLDNSLEISKLEEVYKKHKDEFKEKFLFKIKGCEATTALINVEFEKRVYNFNMYTQKSGRVYVKLGYDIEDIELHDHICINSGEFGEDELIAIEIPYYKDNDKHNYKMENYKKVKNPVGKEVLGNHFIYDEEHGCYSFDKDLDPFAEGGPKLIDRNPTRLFGQVEVREYIYENGFDVDGIHYIRYKRSAGSAREGNCLFIMESLYDEMMEWTNCELNKEDIKDIASWEAYSALTLSSIESTVAIPKASILFMHDEASIFNDNIIKIVNHKEDKKNIIKKEVGQGLVQNNIWDGESLLDSSVFNNNGYKGCGMLLLRNKFFKSCAFNTNIQKWFKDNNITQISQLNGYTTARKVSEIKMIVTDSSLKYLKLKGLPNGDEKEYKEAINIWLKNIEKYFGVVKTEKNTGYLEGNLVATNYQIINTLDLDSDAVKELTSTTLQYMENIKDSPMYMRHYLKYKLELDKLETYVEEGKGYNRDDYLDISILSYYNRAIMEMIALNDDFSKTHIYRKFLYKVTEAIKNNIKHGRVLIKGNYSTLLGNGAELLKASIDKDYEVGESEIAGSNIYTKRFNDGEELFCARSPHITMGNLMLATNQYSKFYDTYFNLSEEIVCVNAINNNIQQRLNGCDYDSDTMLITNNEIMIKAAKAHYNEFLVPTCGVSTKARKYSKGIKGLAELDKGIARNSIGRIVNLSQILNSLYWDNRHSETPQLDIDEIYEDICELAVESGMEIDKAKREYDVNPSSSCRNLTQKYGLKDSDEHPIFFNYLKIKGPKAKQRKLLKRLTGITMDTAMQYMYEAGYSGYLSREDLGMEEGKNQATIPLTSLVQDIDFMTGQNDYKYKGEILNIAKKAQEDLDAIRSNKKYQPDSEKAYLNEQEAAIIDKCMKDIEGKIKNNNIIYLLLKEIDKEEKASGYTAILFSALCLDSQCRFYDMVIKNRTDIMYELVPAQLGTKDSTYIYGIPHNRIPKRFMKTEGTYKIL